MNQEDATENESEFDSQEDTSTDEASEPSDSVNAEEDRDARPEYSDEFRQKVLEYSDEHGPIAAARHFNVVPAQHVYNWRTSRKLKETKGSYQPKAADKRKYTPRKSFSEKDFQPPVTIQAREPRAEAPKPAKPAQKLVVFMGDADEIAKVLKGLDK